MRTAFEEMIKDFCSKKGLEVKYHSEAKKMQGEWFWQAAKAAKISQNQPYISATLATDVELYRGLILNPLSHSRIVSVHRGELQQALQTLQNLKSALATAPI